jgi:asparagine N-glycosylation enzyme membrane subunit Stt3
MTLGAAGWPAPVWKRALFFGLALATALFIQTAMLFVAGLALVAILLVGRGRDALASAGLGFALAAAAVLAHRSGRPPGYPNDAWYLGTPHAAALLAAAAACGVAAWAREPDDRRGWVRSALLGVAVGGLTLASIPGALAGIAQGAGFFGGDPWLREIQEFRPLFRGTLAGALDDFLDLGGGALLAIPFAIRSFRGGGPARRLLSVFAIGLLLAAISSARLVVPAAAILTIPAALLVSDEFRRRRFGLAGALAVVAIAPGVAGCIRILPEVRSVVPSAARPMLDAAGFLKSRAGSSGRVLAPWWAGHVFDVVGARPVIVDNFGAAEGRRLFDEAVGLLLSPREETVERYCRDHGVRFVAIENPIGAVPQTARMLDLPVSLYFAPVAAPAGGRPLYSPTHLLRESFWWRAYLGSESPPRSEPGSPFRHFRLLYPDPARYGDRLPYGSHALQIWELLPPGA